MTKWGNKNNTDVSQIEKFIDYVESKKECSKMKYQNWNSLSTIQKWKAVADELALDTRRGFVEHSTTKEDLLKMVRFLAGEVVLLQARIEGH